MSSFDNLLSSDGRKFTAKIKGSRVSGEIRVWSGSKAYLLQNVVEGSRPADGDLRGYTLSWAVGNGGPAKLAENHVEEFSFSDFDKRETTSNLLDKDEHEFSAIIDGATVTGVIRVFQTQVYLLQNKKNGTPPSDNDCKGFKYSWNVNTGSAEHLIDDSVTEFVLKGKPTITEVKRAADSPAPNLLAMEDYTFTAKLSGTTVSGIIHICEGTVYLCQDLRTGRIPPDKNQKGFRKSWQVGKGTSYDLLTESITEFVLGFKSTPITTTTKLELKPDPIPVFSIGDRVISKPGITTFRHGSRCGKIIGIPGTVVAGCSSGYDSSHKHFVINVRFDDDGDTYYVAEDELENYHDAKIVAKPEPVFSVGDRVITKSAITKLEYGDRIKSIIKIPGTVVRVGEYKVISKSFVISVNFDGYTDSWNILEKELEKYYGDVKTPSPHRSAVLPTSSCRFKPGDRVKVVTTRPYVFGGSYSGNATIKEIKRWYSEGFTSVLIKFDDGPDYEMADYELDFIREAAPRFIDPFSPIFDHSYVEGSSSRSDCEDDDKHKPLEFKSVKRVSL